jgi:predicted DNA-binding protein
MTERTTVRLPGELLTRAKRKAADEGRTLTALIEEGLRRVVAEKPDAAKRERVVPRVSKAKGGFAPGVTSIRDIEELEDREYVERLYKP